MAMNPQSVMSSLRMMSDQQLQQYAAMHKNDPFVFPLAFQESQTRKQMRAESQAQQPPQGKVADQALAAMAPEPLPEEVGIGALPAKNLEGMAAGGIVAFDEGGEVPRYNGLTGSTIYSPEGLPLTGIPGDMTDSDLTILERLGIRNPANRRALEAATRRPVAPVVGKAYTPSVEGMLNPATGIGTPPTSPGPVVPPGPALPPGPAMPPRVAAPQQQLATTPEDITGDLTAMRKALGVDTLKEDVLKRQQDLTAAEKSAADEALEVYKRDIEKQGKGMEGAEARAQARGEKLAKREGDLTGMALLEAGMAIMAGSSPFALQNIGAGAQVGIKSYTAGLDKLQEARDKLDESYDKIEQYRTQRDDMNARERRQFEKDIRQTQVDAQKRGIDALMQFGNMDRADAREGFGQMMRNRATKYEVDSRRELGLAQIAAHERTAAANSPLNLYTQLGLAKPDSPLRQGFELSKEADKFPMLYKLYTSSVADPLKGGEFMARYPTFEAYLEGYQVGKGGPGGGGFTQQLPSNSTLLNKPGRQ